LKRGLPKEKGLLWGRRLNILQSSDNPPLEMICRYKFGRRKKKKTEKKIRWKKSTKEEIAKEGRAPIP